MKFPTALLTFLLALASPGTAGPKDEKNWKTTTGKPFAARVNDISGIKNMAEISPGVFRGGQPSRRGLENLKARGFKTVVSLREYHDERKAVEKSGLNFIRISLDADINGSTHPTATEIEVFLDTVLDPNRQPVFFHCAVGKDRTGTMAAVYRMEVDGWTAAEALEEMQAFGAHDIFKSLIKFVANYRPRTKAAQIQQTPER